MNNAEIFIRYMNSDNIEDQSIARNLPLSVDECHRIIESHPDLKQWVVLNKKVPVQILDELSRDGDENIRHWVACKNSITPEIAQRFLSDPSPMVRIRLLYNKKVPIPIKMLLLEDEDEWVVEQARERLTSMGYLNEG